MELGDVVVRPESGDTRGVVAELILPYSAKAVWHGLRSGGVLVKWDGGETEVSMGLDVFREEVDFVGRR